MRRVISLFQNEKFQQQFPGIGVLKEQNVFVEMQCCSLAIPANARPQEQVDIFSETVLQLAALDRGYTVNQIAERMCVDPDFVRFICIHLKEAGYMDEYCTLTNLGKQHLQMPFAEKESSLDDSLWQVYAFAWPGTQDYLSYLRVGDLAAEQQLFETKDQCGKIQVGTAGNSQEISGRILTSGFKGKVQLQRSLFPALIRRYNRLCRGNSRFQEIPYREGSSVDAAEEGRVLLHCKAVIQEGNSGKILLSDGFSPNCEKLYDAIRKEYPQLERELIENAYSDATDRPQEDLGEEEKVPNARQSIVKAMNVQEAQGQDLDGEQDAKALNSKVVEDLCKAVETAFYEFAAQNRLAEWQLELLRKRNKWECTHQIREWAKEIGISEVEQYDKLLEWPGKRRAEQLLRFDQNSDTEMSAALCLAVAVEKSQGPTNFARLIQKKKNLLKFLSVLKMEGAKARHGEEIDGSRICILKKQCREVILQLLPDLPLDQNKGKVEIVSSAQKRINARVEICNRIGWETFAQLSPEIQNKLLQLSSEAASLPKNEMLMLLSQILEGVLRAALQDMPKPDTPEREELLETIERKRKHALPEEFRHTNPNYLKSALQGNKGVLNAYYLAYLYRCCEKEQSDIVPAAAEDKWVELVSWIHEVRQHTAKAAFRVDRAEMKKRRDDVFAFVKVIEDAI